MMALWADNLLNDFNILNLATALLPSLMMSVGDEEIKGASRGHLPS